MDKSYFPFGSLKLLLSITLVAATSITATFVAAAEQQEDERTSEPGGGRVYQLTGKRKKNESMCILKVIAVCGR